MLSTTGSIQIKFFSYWIIVSAKQATLSLVLCDAVGRWFRVCTESVVHSKANIDSIWIMIFDRIRRRGWDEILSTRERLFLRLFLLCSIHRAPAINHIWRWSDRLKRVERTARSMNEGVRRTRILRLTLLSSKRKQTHLLRMAKMIQLQFCVFFALKIVSIKSR